MSILGFALALFSLFILVPWVDVFIGFLGLVFSWIGVSQGKNKGLGIAGITVAIIAIVGNLSIWLIWWPLFEEIMISL